MDLSRRGFLVGASALAVATPRPVQAVMPLPRQHVPLEGHKEWQLIRPHVLGHMTPDEMAMGLPGPWQEYISHWRTEGSKLFIPMMESGDTFVVKLKSGFVIDLLRGWECYMEKWVREIGIPLYGSRGGDITKTNNLGSALLTNHHLFRMFLKYRIGG